MTDDHIKTNFDASRKMLKMALNLIYQGYNDAIFSFAIEFEFNRVIILNPSISEEELCELTLTKELIRYIRANDSDSIYDLLNYICTGDVRNKLVPNADWVNSPI